MQNEEFQSAIAAMGLAMGNLGGALWGSGQTLHSGTFSGGFTPEADPVKQQDDAIKAAYDNLIKVISKEKELAKARLDSISAIYEISLEAAKDLYRQVDSTRRQSYAQSRMFFDQAVQGIMRGIMPDADKYKDAVDNLMREIAGTAYATKVDADRARLLLANELQSIADQLEPEKTALEQQLEYLAGLEETARLQLEAIQGNSSSIMSLSQAITDWNNARSASGSVSSSTSNSVISTGTTTTPTKTAPTSTSGRNDHIWSYLDPDGWAKAHGLSAFANGGYYPGGLALVGEQGPELINFSNPGQVYTASQTANMLSNDNSELLVDLIEEVQMLRAEVRADVSHNAKTAKLLDRVIPDGRAVAVTVTP
jgi:hypothetical protein